MAIKLEIKNLYKIFGEHPQRAFKYIEQGLSKEQIDDILVKANIDGQRRGETFSLQEFADVANAWADIQA